MAPRRKCSFFNIRSSLKKLATRELFWGTAMRRLLSKVQLKYLCDPIIILFYFIGLFPVRPSYDSELLTDLIKEGESAAIWSPL